jgi:molybdate transport system substrate-binding protein
VSLFALSLLTSGCVQISKATQVQEESGLRGALTIAAASNMIKAFEEIGPAFENANDCEVVFSFGSTGTLTEQIINGAPFDIFVAADENALELLESKKIILSDTRRIFALGRIGVATSKNGNVMATSMEDLLGDSIKKIAIANPDHAPFGLAAKQALISSGLWDQLEPKLVYGKNISDAMTYVTTGNADAGIIASSLNDDSLLNFTLIQYDAHEPLQQTAAVIKSTEQVELARAFIEFITSETGRQILIKYGFAIPQD